MKNNRYGQAAIISDNEYLKIRREIKNKKYKLLVDIAWYTGERWGAIIQLKWSDIFNENKIRHFITFRANTRKASPTGEKLTRQLPIHPTLKEILEDFKPEKDYIFQNRDGTSHLSLRTADKIFRVAAQRAGLESKGISTHSTRRSFITKLHAKGIDLYTIKAITGHKDLKSLARYVEIPANKIQSAIELI
jgi:integrase/recombinase XerD